MAETYPKEFEKDRGPTDLYWPSVAAQLKVLVDKGGGEVEGRKYSLTWHDTDCIYLLSIEDNNQTMAIYDLTEEEQGHVGVTFYGFLIDQNDEEGFLKVYKMDLPAPDDYSDSDGITDLISQQRPIIRDSMSFQKASGFAEATLDDYFHFWSALARSIYLVELSDLMGGPENE